MERPTYIKHKLSNILNINRIISLFYQEFDKNFDFEGESHNFWELVYVDKGEIIATAKNKEVHLKQGDIIFHKPNEFHKLRANGEIAPNVFIVSFDCHSPAMNYFKGFHTRLSPHLRGIIAQISKEGAETFQSLMERETMLKLKENPALGGQQLIAIYLELLLIQIMRGDKTDKIFPTKETFDDHLAEQIIQILESKIYDTLEMEAVCSRLNYSKTYLCTLFKRNTGTSIMNYYNQLKIKEAKKLLREKESTISEISDMLHYCNPHYFSHVFKKFTNMSPREYLNSIQMQ